VTLWSSVDAYCRFLEKPNRLGGYIERDKLPGFHKVDICVLHIEECNMGPVNSYQATKRILLLDMAFIAFLSSSGNWGQTK
jgi:hypothetical protein